MSTPSTESDRPGGPAAAGGPTRAEAGRGGRPAAATTVGWLSVIGVIAAALMAVAHAGVTIPVVSAIGPGGDRAIWPAVVVFAVGAAIYALLAVGAFRVVPWTWPAALAVNALAAMSMLRPFRGVGSVLGLVLFGVTLAVLLSPAGRDAFRRHR